MITLTGFIGIEAAGSGAGARLEITGAVSTTIAYIGSLTGTLNLNVYAGVGKTGVVGRIFLGLSTAGSIPGVSLSGQFLLEINTFSAPRTIDTFKIKKRIVGSVEFFDGFDLDAQGRPKVVTDTISITNGFFLKMAGDLRFGPLTITGEFKLTITTSTLEMVVNAELALNPLGKVTLSNSGFRVNSQGLVARFAVSLGIGDAAFGESVGLELSVTAVVELNTTGRAQTFNNVVVAAGFQLALNGTVSFFGFASAKGSLDITISNSSFQMAASLEFEIGPLLFKVAGSLGIYSNGLTATLDVDARPRPARAWSSSR